MFWTKISDTISSVNLSGKEDDIYNLNLREDMTGNYILHFKYAPLIQIGFFPRLKTYWRTIVDLLSWITSKKHKQCNF